MRPGRARHGRGGGLGARLTVGPTVNGSRGPGVAHPRLSPPLPPSPLSSLCHLPSASSPSTFSAFCSSPRPRSSTSPYPSRPRQSDSSQLPWLVAVPVTWVRRAFRRVSSRRSSRFQALRAHHWGVSREIILLLVFRQMAPVCKRWLFPVPVRGARGAFKLFRPRARIVARAAHDRAMRLACFPIMISLAVRQMTHVCERGPLPIPREKCPSKST